MTDILAKIIPILLLIGLGYLLRNHNFIDQNSIDQLKKMVVNIFLPSVLFVTFIDMDLEPSYIYVFVGNLILLILFYITGVIINRFKVLKHDMLPFVVTGTSFGLLGLSLYETVFGIDNLVKMSILGVGHEIFMWFIYITLLKVKLKNERVSINVVKDFIKSPLIIAVVSGILLNVFNLSYLFRENVVFIGFYNTIKYLASVTTPFILVIVGYGLVINPKYLKQSVRFIILRLVVMLVVGYAFKLLILDKVMTNDAYFDYAYFTFLILPPPMSLPIFTSQYGNKEYGELMNNTVVLSTILCILMFIIFVILGVA